jgi:hypothetical protein
MKSVTLKFKAGYFAGDTSWWTQEDWDEQEKYVAELKKNGEFGKEFERTFNFNEYDEFNVANENKPLLNNFELAVPKGKGVGEVPKMTLKYDSNKDDFKLL